MPVLSSVTGAAALRAALILLPFALLRRYADRRAVRVLVDGPANATSGVGPVAVEGCLPTSAGAAALDEARVRDFAGTCGRSMRPARASEAKG